MADRIFIIPRRNDLAGVGINLGDLHPNAGQKNSVYAGTHQNVYVAEALDQLGATVQNGLAWRSGSLNTDLTSVAGYNDIDDDTTGGGDDVSATQLTSFGLAAYLFDRVDPGGAAGAGTNPMTVAQATTIAQTIMDVVDAGTALTLAAIDAILTAAPISAATDLDGAAANSDSFGSVRDILRILSGEIYRVPLLTILGDVSTGTGDFLGLAARQALVDAQTAAQVVSQGQFYSSGSFLAADDAGYRARPTLVPTGAFNSSNASGVVAGYKGNITVLNRDFAYTAGAVSTWRPRALALDTTVIPATGIWPAFAVYDQDGTAL